jgi:hypothetical protein
VLYSCHATRHVRDEVVKRLTGKERTENRTIKSHGRWQRATVSSAICSSLTATSYTEAITTSVVHNLRTKRMRRVEFQRRLLHEPLESIGGLGALLDCVQRPTFVCAEVPIFVQFRHALPDGSNDINVRLRCEHRLYGADYSAAR